MAITFREELPAGRSFLLGHDILRDVLARARVARYSDWSLRGEGVASALPYLGPRGGRPCR